MSEPPSNRKLLIDGDITDSVIIVGGHNSASNISQSSSTPDRLKFIQILNALPTAQPDEIVFALHPPSGNIPGSAAPQGQRSKALLN